MKRKLERISNKDDSMDFQGSVPVEEYFFFQLNFRETGEEHQSDRKKEKKTFRDEDETAEYTKYVENFLKVNGIDVNGKDGLLFLKIIKSNSIKNPVLGSVLGDVVRSDRTIPEKYLELTKGINLAYGNILSEVFEWIKSTDENFINSSKLKQNDPLLYSERTFSWSRRTDEILLNILKFGSYKAGQLTSINAMLFGNDTVTVMPTGGGKSLCYIVPSIVCKGVTVVISPLLSLINDQITFLSKKVPSLVVVKFNSDLGVSEKERIINDITSNTPKTKLLFTTPESIVSHGVLLKSLLECAKNKNLVRFCILFSKNYNNGTTPPCLQY